MRFIISKKEIKSNKSWEFIQKIEPHQKYTIDVFDFKMDIENKRNIPIWIGAKNVAHYNK